MLRKLTLRGIVFGYLTFVLVAPLVWIFKTTFAQGVHPIWSALSDPNTVHAFEVTLEAAAIAVPLNTVFGVVRARDRPAAVPREGPPQRVHRPAARRLAGRRRRLARPVYGRGPGGSSSFLASHGTPIIYALPAIVLATIFVSVPFVAREVMPTLRELGTEQEQAAATLGASRLQRFWRIAPASLRWAIIYGVVLTTARCLGEYGAVAVVSGRIEGVTETAPIRVRRGRTVSTRPARMRSPSSLHSWPSSCSSR